GGLWSSVAARGAILRHAIYTGLKIRLPAAPGGLFAAAIVSLGCAYRESGENAVMSIYLETVKDVYAEAARNPEANLCCTTSPGWRLPDLRIPGCMLAMNYGCGSTVDLRELRAGDTVIYVGVGGGLEALQFAYCTRRVGGVIAVDPVDE